MKRKIFITAVFSIFYILLNAQPDINFLDKASYLKLGGGMLIPGTSLSSTSADGLFAKNGYQIGFDYNYIIAYGFGVGANLEIDNFKFDNQAFVDFSQASEMEVKGGYKSTKFGLNVLFNMPILVASDNFVINLYAEGNAGIRGMSIPSIDLYYDELFNKYIEVSYRPRSSTMGYLGYSGGLQFIFLERFGVNVSYNEVLKSRHSIKYSVRSTDSQGELYEDESYVNNYLDHKGLQFALFFVFGK